MVKLMARAILLLALANVGLALLSERPLKRSTAAELATRLRTENPRVATLYASQLAEGGAAPVQGQSSSPNILKRILKLDYVLLAYIGFWYLGNYFYNITNKRALKAAGGIDGFPALIATAQLGVGAIYSLYLWLAPDARKAPTVTLNDYVKMIPVGFCAAAAHGASVFSLGAGSVSFAQIVKSCEPAFAAVIGALLYGKAVSTAKWLTLIPVIGGVIIASATELNFSVVALFSACLANCFAAFKGNENKKLMETAGIRERLGTVGNQFAVTNFLAFLISAPIALMKEGTRFGEFLDLCKTSNVVWNNMLASGILFYLYNELATLTIKKTSAVTQSVANTAKRAIVILGVAIALGESLSPAKIVGSVICILGVLLYSNADALFPPKK